MSEWKKYWVWSIFNGLAVAISITHGIDITQEGIARIILEGFRGLYPAGLYLLLDLLILTIGIISIYKEIKDISEEDISIVILCASWFLALFLLFIGMDLKIEWIEQIGVIPLLVGVFMLWWIAKEERG